ncbi:class I adenylate-forming enzyme family protein [Streptomyces pilosus]|uniref:Long-chain-fatty-acid--CoA ligase n=1 Tax=Streptomyces pilosus TaxID=28893 RepID=A0A918F5S3_9ACTN|nr:AMP-binding protein [Streptomyces pilosus]GGR03625.1 long-chain-fatty-acid--CoA ligase [Streptomyces pilosus]
MPFASRVLRAGLSDPDSVAVVLDGTSTTYRELAGRGARVARALRELPRRPRAPFGDIHLPSHLVAVLTDNAPQLPELLVGATSGDGACALLDPQWSAAQTAEVLRRLGPDLLVTQRARSAAADAATALHIPVVMLDGDASAPDSFDGWLAAHCDADPERELTSGDDDSVFFVGFTSGTTSTPKAFAMARGCWRTSLALGAPFFDTATAQVSAAPGPLQHGVTLYALAEALDAGTTFVGARRFEARELMRAVRAHRVQRLSLVPSMLHALCRDTSPGQPPLETVTVCISSGARLDADLVTRAARLLPRARFVDYYGASETGFISVLQHPLGDRGKGVGHPFPRVEIEVRDPHGRVCAAGVPGEIHVRSPYVSRGYLWAADETRMFAPGGWVTVGDQGHLDADGTLHLVGRKGRMVITGGWNVYPDEVEAVLRTIPGIDDAVVAGVPDAFLGTALVAVTACSGPGGPPAYPDVVRSCRAALPSYKVPVRVYTVPALPRTTSGKVARAEVDDWLARAHGGDSPLTELAPRPGRPS